MYPRIPPVTKYLIIACAVAFLLQNLPVTAGLMDWLVLWPIGAGAVPGAHGFLPWQLLSYGFLHGSITHLLFNLLALWMFGSALELVWGPKRYLSYFLVCVAGAGLIQMGIGWLELNFNQRIYPTVGASGGIFGLLLANGLLWPKREVMLIIPPIPMTMRTFVILYGITELVLGYTGWQPGVAHFAHLGGMFFGWMMIRYWRGQWPFGRRRPPGPPPGGGGGRRDHLRVVR